MQNATINISKIKKGERVEVTLEGEMTIANMEVIAEKIKKAVTPKSVVAVNAVGVTGYDLTFLQMLLSIKSSGSKNELHFLIEEEKKEEFLLTGFRGLF